jgi:hypothetical protein
MTAVSGKKWAIKNLKPPTATPDADPAALSTVDSAAALSVGH